MMEKLEIHDIWRSDGVYTNHRIPGMIVTVAGTLLLCHEARRGFSDWSRMDILLQRSEDCGKTFSEPIPIACGNEEHPTVNNPTLVQDQKGRVHILFCEDYAIKGGRVLHRFSDDDGRTWSEIHDITDATAPETRNVFAIGPGHGICTPDGTLIVTVWMVPKAYQVPIDAHTPSVNGTLYSRDGGEHWTLGDTLPFSAALFSPSEAELAVLKDGTVYLNCRLGGGWRHRGRAYSKNGFSDWSAFEPDRSLWDPCCFGSTVSFDRGEEPLLLFANCEDKESRSHVTVKASKDGGKTWGFRRMIDRDRGGYAEMAADAVRDRIYVVYESNWGAELHLAVFDSGWLAEQSDGG